MIEEDLRMAHIIYKYIQNAMSEVIYEKLDDEYAGKILCCRGVIAFAPTLEECEDELLSVLEDWILIGLRLGHTLPVVKGIDLNKELNLTKESIHGSKKFIKRLKKIGFTEAHGTKYDYMIYGHHRLAIPKSDKYSVMKLRTMIKEAETILGRKISANEWNGL